MGFLTFSQCNFRHRFSSHCDEFVRFVHFSWLFCHHVGLFNFFQDIVDITLLFQGHGEYNETIQHPETIFCWGPEFVGAVLAVLLFRGQSLVLNRRQSL